MPVSSGVAIVMAERKVICGTNNPVNEASTIKPMSLRAIRSPGRNSEISQNSALAPAARSVNKTTGGTASAFAISLQKIRFSPKIV